ncbi:MAG TPA: CPBP family intramembrane glutamic endopeptidase [Usitatibacter sp.]|nr:CPBP family intramembrane glutamic endopeptidase [Usitatibacter sp.]
MEGAVRARHIVFLYVVIFAVTSVVGYKLGRSSDPLWQFAWQDFFGHLIAASLVALVTLVVPELRRSLPVLYTPSRVPLAARDVVLFVALMWSWAYGASRVLFVFPLLEWRPGLFTLFGYQEHFPHVGAGFVLLYTLASAVIAPITEELVFRGFLQNLWQHRFGLWPGVAFSALAFGLSHIQFTFFATLAGVFFSLIYIRFRSLVPGTLLHGLYNLAAAPFIFGPFFLEKNPARIGSLSSWIPELVLAVFFFPLLVVFWRRFRPTP